MKVKLIDAEHELDLEERVNQFLAHENYTNIVDMKYSTSHFVSEEEQIYSFSVLIMYE